MEKNRIAEVVVFNIDSAIGAERGGANRVELCESNAEGGTTPSFGTIEQALKKIKIDVHVMIRPRGGDFLYSESEFEVMKSDVKQCSRMGVKGIVFGVLHPNGDVDVDRCKELASLAGNMTLNFHRAFDRVYHPEMALEQLIECGFSRVLTSGLKASAYEGKSMIQKLVKLAGNRIVIMPGGGVRLDNIRELVVETGAVEFHTSARTIASSLMEYRNPEITADGSRLLTDETIIRQFVTRLNEISN